MSEFYQLLSPFDYSSSPKYRFILNSDLIIQIPSYNFGYAHFYSQDTQCRLIFMGSKIMIPAGYTWDGASPKFRVGNSWVGTPDFNCINLATIIHDALYQFKDLKCFKLKRKDCDDVFLGIMRQNEFKLDLVYYGAVRVFGGVYSQLTSGNKSGLTCHVD